MFGHLGVHHAGPKRHCCRVFCSISRGAIRWNLTRDNLSSAISFYENFKITYPTFIDDSLLIGFKGSLIPNAIPTTIIIDKNNKVAVRISGEVTVAGLRDLLNKVLTES